MKKRWRVGSLVASGARATKRTSRKTITSPSASGTKQRNAYHCYQFTYRTGLRR
jgi:hypothetical protein